MKPPAVSPSVLEPLNGENALEVKFGLICAFNSLILGSLNSKEPYDLVQKFFESLIFLVLRYFLKHNHKQSSSCPSCHVLWQRRRLCQIVWITSCNKLLLMLPPHPLLVTHLRKLLLSLLLLLSVFCWCSCIVVQDDQHATEQEQLLCSQYFLKVLSQVWTLSFLLSNTY